MDGFHNRFQFRNSLCRAVTCLNCLLCCLDLFCTANISRILSGQCELCKSKRIGTVGRCLARRDQLVSGSNRIVDLGNNLQDQVVCKCSHLRPVFDIRSKLNLYAWICHALAVKYTVLVDRLIEVVFMLGIASVKLLC